MTVQGDCGAVARVNKSKDNYCANLNAFIKAHRWEKEASCAACDRGRFEDHRWHMSFSSIKLLTPSWAPFSWGGPCVVFVSGTSASILICGVLRGLAVCSLDKCAKPSSCCVFLPKLLLVAGTCELSVAKAGRACLMMRLPSRWLSLTVRWERFTMSPMGMSRFPRSASSVWR